MLAEQINPTEELQNSLVNPFGFVPVGNIVTFMDCMDDEVIAEGPAECLSGETCLIDPLTGESNTVKWFCDKNIRPRVMTLRGTVSLAGAPFKKGHDELYRVWGEDGSYFDATAKHLVLSEAGFCFVGSLRLGQHLYGYSQDLRASNLVDDLLESQQDAHHLCEIARDYQGNCLTGSYPYDGPLPYGQEAGQDNTPLPGGAQGHSDRARRRDVLDNTSRHNHPYQSYDHLSSENYPFPFVDTVYRDSQSSLPANILPNDDGLYQFGRQYRSRTIHPQSSQEYGHDFPNIFPFYKSPLFYYTVQSKRVQEVEYLGLADYYDMTVPYWHHYFAQGFIHHNTGKTLAALNKLHRTACRFPGCQLSIIRKTYKSMAGSVLMTYENKVLGSQSQVGGYGGSRPSWYDYPNGSRIWIDGMDEPTRVLSSERDIIYVNQAEELSLIEWQTLSTRVTGRAGNIPNPQLIGDCNPGAPTHWIKSRTKQGNLTLIHTGHKDNPTLWDSVHEAWTKQGERTLRKLSKLTGTMRLRLLNGMWAQPEGAIYNMFLEETHKVESFYPNAIWPRVVGIDPIGANIAAVWLAYDPIQGILNAYREYTEPFGISTPQHVDNLLGLSRGEGIFAWVAGAVAERQARVDLNAYGIPAMPPPVSDVWTGIDRIIQLLQDCKLVIHDSCPGLLSEIGAYSRRTDPKTGRIEDEIADKETYHLLDALRYAVVWLTTPMEERRDVVYSPIPIGLEY